MDARLFERGDADEFTRAGDGGSMSKSIKLPPKFYELRSAEFWGDYGRILSCGYPPWPSRRKKQLLIKRTGPFVPPIAAIPLSALIATDDFRRKLESRFPGLSFVEVIKDKIVELHWESWDRTKDPEVLPPDGEPEGYIEDSPHSPETAAQMGPLWEVVVPDTAVGEILKGNNYQSKRAIRLDSWNGADLILVELNDLPKFVVTEVGKEWFEREVGEWVSFRPWLVLA